MGKKKITLAERVKAKTHDKLLDAFHCFRKGKRCFRRWVRCIEDGMDRR